MFKGREAKLNRAILRILTGTESSLSIWDMMKRINANRKRGSRKVLYHNVNTRVRDLEAEGFLRRVGEKETKAKDTAALYAATAKAYFAQLVNSLDIDELINELEEAEILAVTAIIAVRKRGIRLRNST